MLSVGRYRQLIARASKLAVATVIVAFSAGATAEQSRNLDLPRFDPAPPGDRFFGVPSPYTPGNTLVHAGVLLDYAHNPLILTDGDGNPVGHVVEHQVLLHLNAALMLFGRVQVNADLPFALVNRGAGTFEAGAFTGANAFVSPEGAGLGDLRLGARAQLLGEYLAGLHIAVGLYVWLPTGARKSFLTDGHLRAQPQLLLGGILGRFIWAAMGGPTFRSAQTYGGAEVRSQLNGGAGLGVLLGARRAVQVTMEATGGVTLQTTQSQSMNAEALVGIRYRTSGPLEIGAAVGQGLALGIGTPDSRGVVTLHYAPRARIATPAPASDDNRIVARPMTKQDPVRAIAAIVKEEGGDRDGDGVPDRQDACPTLLGSPTADTRTNGCPGDGDQDGFRDDQDACPQEKGADDADPTRRGCPKLVRVTEKEILILEQIQFETGKATIQVVSASLLDSIAQVMTEHPEITQIEVQGHTDDRGAKRANVTLSQQRAEMAAKALVSRGIDAGRLLAKGYGPDAPIASNDSDEGRRQNRRVQFLVVARAPAAVKAPAVPLR